MSACAVSRLALDAVVSVHIARDYLLRGLLRPVACTSDDYGLFDHARGVSENGKNRTLRPQLPEVCVPFLSWLCFHRREPMQDATGIDGLLAPAALTQFTELPLDLGQLSNTHVDMGDVLVQQLVDGATIASGLIHESQQRADFLVRYI